MTAPFHGRFADDTRYLGYMLDNLDDYQDHPENLLEVLRASPTNVVTGIFGDPVAVSTVTNWLGTLPGGAAAVDDDTIIQYCNQLVVLIDEIDGANEGVEEDDSMVRDERIRQRLDDAEQQLNLLLDSANDLLNLVPANTTGTGLADWLRNELMVGGCNNVFAGNARVVVEPLAMYGYETTAGQVRRYLLENFQVAV